MHVSLLSANEYFVLNPRTNKLVRQYRAPKSLKPHMTLICDNLLRVYKYGVRAYDASVPVGMPGHYFRCKCILLLWSGDYPGISSVSGMSGGRCHWCHYAHEHVAAVNRKCWDDHRCLLPRDHRFQLDAEFGGIAPERPALRTHAEVIEAAVENEAWEGKQDSRNAPWQKTSVKQLSPLCALPLFDMIWDMGPDGMHLNDNIFETHGIDVLCGRRHPNRPKARASWSTKENQQLQKDYEYEIKICDKWQLSTKDQNVSFDYPTHYSIPSVCSCSLLRTICVLCI